MTRDRRLKKRVRARAARTGESYSVAYQLLRERKTEETAMTENEFQTITNHDFGYTIKVPSGWRDVGPDIYNSAFEVARYLRNSPAIHDGIVNIFWGIPGESHQSTAKSGDPAVFDLSKEGLEKEGLTVTLKEIQVGDRLATLLEYAYRLGNIEHWASRSYFMEVRGTVICLNMASADMEADGSLYDKIVQSFSPIEETAGIVLVHDGVTPSTYISQLLVDQFDYTHRQATQKLVKIRTQKESVVALVEADRALKLVDSINQASVENGYSLSCRVAS
jgi:ATP-dependent Clp protease adapter protein ClpS